MTMTLALELAYWQQLVIKVLVVLVNTKRHRTPPVIRHPAALTSAFVTICRTNVTGMALRSVTRVGLGCPDNPKLAQPSRANENPT